MLSHSKKIGVVILILQSLASAASAATIDFDSVFIPASGVVKLQRGNEYKLTKTKWLRSCSIVADGVGASPIISYSGPRDYAAIQVRAGDKASIAGVKFVIGEWNVAIEAYGSAVVSDCEVADGGFLKVAGANGVVSCSHIRQTSPCKTYFIYVGPEVIVKRDWLGRMTEYRERNAVEIKLFDVDAMQGSSYLSLMRAQGFDRLSAIQCKFSDTDAQSAPGAVRGAVIRVHHAGDASFKDIEAYGDVNIGPMDGGDGGRDKGATLKDPKGLERKFFDSKRLASVRMFNANFTGDNIRVASGVQSLSVVGSTWTVKTVNAIGVAWPYMNRPRSVATFLSSALKTGNPSGGLFWPYDAKYSPDAKAAAGDFTFTMTTLNGVPIKP